MSTTFKFNPLRCPQLCSDSGQRWFLHNPDMDMVVYFSKVEAHHTTMRIRWCQPLPEGRTPDPDREWAFWDTGPARGPLQEGMVDLSEARTLWDTIKSNGYNPIHPSHLSFGK